MECAARISSLYEPLQHNPYHFRLLRAAHGRNGSSLIVNRDGAESPRPSSAQAESCKFELQSFLHAEAPPYVALSYTWGSPFGAGHELDRSIDWIHGTQTVIINSRLVAVRQNLADALLELLDSSLADVWFWVDAICINQDDIHEKNIQVSRMRDIYTRASTVDVWLGRADKLTEDAWNLDSKCLRPLWERLQDQRLQDHISIADPDFYLDSKEPGTVELFRRIAPETKWFTAWAKLHRRTWFTRSWVLQECVLNFSNAVFHCGHRSFNLLKHTWVWRLALGLLRSEDAGSDPVAREVLNVHPTIQPFFFFPPKESGQWLHESGSYTLIEKVSSFTDGDPGSATLLKMILFETRLLDTTNPSDKLFAILGLHEHLQTIMKTPQTVRIGIQYMNTAAETFCSFTEYLLRNCASLSILSFWNDMTVKAVGDLPSWVPDYSLRDPFEIHVNGRRSTAFTQDYRLSLNAANVDVRNPSKILRTFGPGSFTLLGSRLDKIVDTESLVSESDPQGLGTEGKDEWTTINTILNFSLHLPTIYFNGQERIEAVWRTLIWDYWSQAMNTPTPATLETAQKFQNYILGSLCLSVCHAFAKASYSNCSWNGLQDRRPEVRQLADAHIRVLGLCYALVTAEASVSPNYSQYTPLAHPIVTGYNVWVSQLMNGFRERLESVGIVGAGAFFSSCMDRALNDFLPFRGEARYFNRAIFSTFNQHYIGLGPMSTSPGDEVWLLENGRAAYILREVDKAEENYRWDGGEMNSPEPVNLYRLVGECYVHGIMRGELFGPRRRRGPCDGRDASDEEADAAGSVCINPMCQTHSALSGKVFEDGENPPQFEELTLI